MMRSRARFGPMRAGRRYVPPAPGIIANRVSGRPTVAVDENTRKFVARASSRPPPKAWEEIAVMDGIGREASRVRVLRRVVRNCDILRRDSLDYQFQCLLEARKDTHSSGLMPTRSFKSAPAQKA